MGEPFGKREIFRKYPDVVDVTQLCKMLGGSRPVSKKTAYRLLTSGKIKAFRLGRSYRIPKVNVIRFLQNGLSDECNTDDSATCSAVYSVVKDQRRKNPLLANHDKNRQFVLPVMRFF